jgi:hypothetical protein
VSRPEIDDRKALAAMAKLIRRGASARQAARTVAEEMGEPGAVERLRRKEQEARGGCTYSPRLRFSADEWAAIQRAAGRAEPGAWLRRVVLEAAGRPAD